MLLSIKHLGSYKIEATDGSIGGVYSFLIDDRNWIVRYLVVDTGSWLPGRRVLIAPSAIGNPEGEAKRLPLHLTKKQIEESPDIDMDMPVSRKQEMRLYQHYNWTPYWPGGLVPAGATFAPSPAETKEKAPSDNAEIGENADPHLRSTKEIINYRIHAEDGEIGHVEDFILDIDDWIIRYVVVDTRNWLPGKKVIIAPAWIQEISWADSMVSVSLSKAAVKGSPEFDPSMPINLEYETRLYDYYGRPKYWT